MINALVILRMAKDSAVGSKGKVCVTGAAGYLGSAIVKQLLELGYQVEGAVRDPGDYKRVGHLWELQGAKERLHLVRAELMEEGSFDSAVKGCEGVFHTAFPVLYPKYDPQAEVIDPAVKGTLNLLKSCAKNPDLKKVVLTSSISSIARPATPPTRPLDESSWSSVELCEKLNLWYPLAKVLTEKAAWEFAKENNINLITIIPSFIIGASIPHTLHETASDFLSLLKGEEKFARRGRQGYVHIDDVVTCHILAYEDATAEGRYICTSTIFEVPDLVAFLSKRYPWLPVCTSFSNYVQRPKFEYNTSKAQKLGVTFKGSEEMFDDCIQSLKEQGYLP